MIKSPINPLATISSMWRVEMTTVARYDCLGQLCVGEAIVIVKVHLMRMLPETISSPFHVEKSTIVL
jgi:hypothetical protein